MKKDVWLRMALMVIAWAAVFSGGGLPAAAPAIVYASDKPVERVYLGEPEAVWWETDTLGKWSSVRSAHEYQVKLYIADDVERDEEDWRSFDPDAEGLEAAMVRRTSETSCDFREYMSDLHTYFFVVRAVPKTSEQAYVESGRWVASWDMDFREKEVIGITEGKWRNYLEGSRYEDGNGEFLPGGWHRIRGNWYLLDEGGYRLSGWQQVDGVRYYLGSDGRMASGWFVWEGGWYYADKNGAVQTGWIMEEPGKYYKLDENGRWNGETASGIP